MGKINIAELLKDCPRGMKLYSPIFGEVYLDKIRPHLAIVVTTDKEQGDFKEEFLYDGRYDMKGECMIFPSKDQRDWSKFHRPFKDGDIVITDNNEHAFIYSGENDNFWECYCGVYCGTRTICIKSRVWSDKKHKICLATEEEKEELFKVIKDNGYYWNSETKTLEKLFPYNIGTKVWVKSDKEHEYIHTIIGISHNCLGNLEYEVKEEKTGIIVHYPKELLIPITTKEPKFKAGDKVRHKNNHNVVFTITSIEEDSYVCGTKLALWFDDQDKYELVPDKFDITTLKPFDSRVLVRDSDSESWRVSFWGCLINNLNGYDYYDTTRGYYKQCIPYENNEHLLGKTEDCKDFYKTW